MAVGKDILVANVIISKPVLSAPTYLNAFYVRLADMMDKKRLFTTTQKLMIKKNE